MDGETDPETVQQLDSPTCHLSDLVDDFFTICGLTIITGAPRRVWAETPEVERCHSCRGQLRTIAATLPSDRSRGATAAVGDRGSVLTYWAIWGIANRADVVPDYGTFAPTGDRR